MNDETDPKPNPERPATGRGFSLNRFYRENRRILIWIILGVLLWLLRSFFSLIFLTFVFAFIAGHFADFLVRRLHMHRRVAICATFAALVAVLVTVVTFVVPQVAKEAMNLVGNLPKTEVKLLELQRSLTTRYPTVEPVLMNYLRSTIPDDLLTELSAKSKDGAETAAAGARDDQAVIHLFLNYQIQKLTAAAPGMIRAMWAGSATVLLSLLFSFLISLDLVRLIEEVRSLRDSRLRHFYEETALPVVRFGYVVGRSIQAQAMIAILNTVLTWIGLALLGIPSLTVLLMIVFLCSFIPVLGVFISTIPIVLVALNAGGLYSAILVVLMVIVIHAIEAYLLNPMIYGRHLKINPVFVLIILFIGHHAFGVWGMLLGVPVVHYFLHDVFGVPMWKDRRAPRPQPAAPGGDGTGQTP